PHAFSREVVLKRVAEFVVCDDQSLALASKATFRNCLVAMRPSAIQLDLPMTHDICMYIHNAFVDLLKDLKDNIQV
ncbi:hypothetical protein SCLCIDRAFT_74820, partial [Scleroderma citrinum Foug A]